MRDRERGYTLLEMLLVIGILGVLLAGVAETLRQARRADALCESRAGDVLGLGRAIAALEADLRESTRVETVRNTHVHITTPRGEVVYVVDEGALLRTSGGRTSPLVRNALDLRVTREGAFFRARVRLAHVDQFGPRLPMMTTLVAPRSAGEGP